MKSYFIINYITHYSKGQLIIEKSYYAKKCKKIMVKLKDCVITSFIEVPEKEL